MKRLLDHDPMTGITEYFHEDSQTGEWAIETVQDVQPSLEAANIMRNDPEHTKQGIKNGMWHYAHLDNVVITKMINEEGVNPYDPNDAKKLDKLIKKGGKYEYCRLTDGYHKLTGKTG
jgi:hypothetical protein